MLRRGKADIQMSWSSPSAAFSQFRDQRHAVARGGSRIDGRGVLVGLASHGSRAQARQLGGSGGMLPQENVGFQEF